MPLKIMVMLIIKMNMQLFRVDLSFEGLYLILSTVIEFCDELCA